MSPYFLLILAAVLGYLYGVQRSRKKFSWRKAILASTIGLVVAFGITWFTRTATPRAPQATPLADNIIVIDQPLPGATVRSPLKVTGKARGNWFFEASFPVTLTNWDGLIIAQTPAQAQGDWMTTDWVPFTATLTFTEPVSPVSSRGFLILKKDNPSGLPANDDSREITVFFGK